MAFLIQNLYIDRGRVNDSVGGTQPAIHKYLAPAGDTLDATLVTGYFPDALDHVAEVEVKTNDLIHIQTSTQFGAFYKITALSPLTLGDSGIVFSSIGFQNAGLPAVASVSNINVFAQDDNNTFTFSGPWAAPKVSPVTFLRINNTVSLTFNETQDTAVSAVVASVPAGSIPEIYRPTIGKNVGIAVIDNSSGQMGLAIVNPDGSMSIESTLAGGAFTGAGVAGWRAISIEYSLVVP